MDHHTEGYAAGFHDGVRAERERHEAERAGGMTMREWRVMVSLECMVAWLENRCDPTQVVDEIRRDIALLRGVQI